MVSTQEATTLVTKAEALGAITRFIERPGVTELPVFEELLKWQGKLTRWLAQERTQREQAAYGQEL